MSGGKVHRRPQKRADYLLRYTRDFPIAVIEAKAEYLSPGTGLQQAKDYAEIQNPNAAADLEHLPPERLWKIYWPRSNA